MKKLGLSEEYSEQVHDIIAEESVFLGCKLTYKEGLAVIKEALGLL
jgi:hypothetical protein